MRTLILAAAILLPQLALAGGYEDHVDEFFSLTAKGREAEAMKGLVATNPVIDPDGGPFRNLHIRWDGLDEVLGAYKGHLLLDTSTLGDRFVQVTYLVMYENQPIRVEIQFYRPEKEWKMYWFGFDDDLDEVLKEAARARVAARVE